MSDLWINLTFNHRAEIPLLCAFNEQGNVPVQHGSLFMKTKENENLIKIEGKMWVQTRACNEILHTKTIAKKLSTWEKVVGGSVALTSLHRYRCRVVLPTKSLRLPRLGLRTPYTVHTATPRLRYTCPVQQFFKTPSSLAHYHLNEKMCLKAEQLLKWK